MGVAEGSSAPTGTVTLCPKPEPNPANGPRKAYERAPTINLRCKSVRGVERGLQRLRVLRFF
ncbi:MAG TPA: hypothetical protein ENJ59_00350 [Thermofilum sp.]|nr:hypothetical protein [Thermofilum sp.]